MKQHFNECRLIQRQRLVVGFLCKGLKMSVQLQWPFGSVRSLSDVSSGTLVHHVTWCFALHGNVALKDAAPVKHLTCAPLRTWLRFVGGTVERTAPFARYVPAVGVSDVASSELVPYTNHLTTRLMSTNTRASMSQLTYFADVAVLELRLRT